MALTASATRCHAGLVWEGGRFLPEAGKRTSRSLRTPSTNASRESSLNLGAGLPLAASRSRPRSAIRLNISGNGVGCGSCTCLLKRMATGDVILCDFLTGNR